MFIGREKELALLEKLKNSSKFEFLVLFGRRRIGKTTLLTEFAKDKNVLFYSAQEQNDAFNLEQFTKEIQKHFKETGFSFNSWQDAFEYISNHSTNEHKEIIIIDEFPFIAKENPTVKSILQHLIDHKLQHPNILLIICGSSISFMENEVMGYKSPLYGRCTNVLELKEFDYFDSAKFLPKYTNIDKLMSYAILGGIPKYLLQFDDDISLKENVNDKIVSNDVFLNIEPQLLLKMELKDIATYSTILGAIATGASKLNDISLKAHLESTTCNKYLSVLKTLRLIHKTIPFKDSENSKKGLYTISDNLFNFVYHFIVPRRSAIDLLGEDVVTDEIFEPNLINTYVDHIFEKICTQYMVRLARAKKLPFMPTKIGRWWGNNPIRKCQDDIDIALCDSTEENYIICECKFKNEPFSNEDFENMISRKDLIAKNAKVYYYAFSKSSFSDNVVKKSHANHVTLIGIDDLFEI